VPVHILAVFFAEELIFLISHAQMDTLSDTYILILNIGQSTPIAGAANKITVTFQTNVEVSGNERQNITLSGLSNAIADSELRLQDVADSYGLFQFFE
jgi:ACT domain-containing protein